MKKLFLLLAFFSCTPAHAQSPGTVTNHAFAIGKGPHVTGYTSLLCGSAQLAVGQAAADPICKTITGDWTLSAAGVATLATVNANVGTFGSATSCVTVTNNAKGLTTAISAATCTPAIGSITGLGTGILAALQASVGSAGAPVLFNGAGGTPTSLTLTNATGLPTTALTGALQAAQEPAHTGDMTNTAGSLATTVVKINGSTPAAVATSGSASDLTTGTLAAARAPIVSAFSVNKNATDQTGVASATFTQITFANEVYDINAHFASNGWTPNAGKVTMNATFLASGTITAGATCAISIFKNGSSFKQTTWGASTGSASAFIATDDVANGTDVYTIQAFVTTSTGTATISGNIANTYFTGHWISP